MTERDRVVDELAGEGLFLVQSGSGVKASVDGILLARYVKPSRGQKVADLGCGNGLVSLVLAYDHPECSVLGVDVQADLVRQASEGASLSGLKNAHFLCGDLRTPPWGKAPGLFDLAVANPPYYKLGSGRLSPDPARAAARHELLGTVNDFARAAASLVREGGMSAWIYLPERLDDLLEALKKYDFSPARKREVLPRKGRSPSFVLVEAVKGKAVETIHEEPSLVLYEEGVDRNYTDEARKVLYGF